LRTEYIKALVSKIKPTFQAGIYSSGVSSLVSSIEYC
jgi:hypothetical protein